MSQMHIDYFDRQSFVYAEVGMRRINFELSKKERKREGKLIPTEDPNIDIEYILRETKETIEYLKTIEAKLTGVIEIKFDDDI